MRIYDINIYIYTYTKKLNKDTYKITLKAQLITKKFE